MSAAATAAGYLYASGRLRGRATREQEESAEPQEQPRQQHPKPAAQHERPKIDRPVRVAALPSEERPKRVPRIQYRARRWRPEQETQE